MRVYRQVLLLDVEKPGTCDMSATRSAAIERALL